MSATNSETVVAVRRLSLPHSFRLRQMQKRVGDLPLSPSQGDLAALVAMQRCQYTLRDAWIVDLDNRKTPLGTIVTPSPSRTQCRTISSQPVSIFGWTLIPVR